MMMIPKPDEAHDDLVSALQRVAARNVFSDAELELAGGMSQPVNVSAPSKDQHHCAD